MQLLSSRAARTRDFESGIAHGDRGDSGEPAVPVPARAGARATQRAGPTVPDRRSGAGVAPVVLPVGRGARRRARSTLAQQGKLSAPGVLDEAGARGCWRDREPDALVDALRRAVAAAARRRQDAARRAALSVLRPARSAMRFKRETELFFDSLVREDRSVLDLLTADYTFVNERHRAALRHPERHRQRVPARHAAGRIAAACSARAASSRSRRWPTARRRCMRGKWVMEVLLGSPPPPPPPNVPALEATKRDRRAASCCPCGERMEEHRENPACASCHRVIDPLGLALENFESTGKWRIKDNGVPVDSRGVMYDGTKMDGPAGLARRAAEAPGRRSCRRSPRT